MNHWQSINTSLSLFFVLEIIGLKKMPIIIQLYHVKFTRIQIIYRNHYEPKKKARISQFSIKKWETVEVFENNNISIKFYYCFFYDFQLLFPVSHCWMLN